VVYDRREAYEAGYWSEAMKTLGFAVQIEMALPAPADDRSNALLVVSIFKPDDERKALLKKQSFTTTQGQFVGFLRSGNLEDLGTVGKAED
jgi:hypothetical protein